MQNVQNENLYGWVFSYNPYTQLWAVAEREYYTEIFSSYKSEHVFRSKDIKVLMELINKTQGDSTKIKNLLDEY